MLSKLICVENIFDGWIFVAVVLFNLYSAHFRRKTPNYSQQLLPELVAVLVVLDCRREEYDPPLGLRLAKRQSEGSGSAQRLSKQEYRQILILLKPLDLLQKSQSVPNMLRYAFNLARASPSDLPMPL